MASLRGQEEHSMAEESQGRAGQEISLDPAAGPALGFLCRANSGLALLAAALSSHRGMFIGQASLTERI